MKFMRSTMAWFMNRNLQDWRLSKRWCGQLGVPSSSMTYRKWCWTKMIVKDKGTKDSSFFHSSQLGHQTGLFRLHNTHYHYCSFFAKHICYTIYWTLFAIYLHTSAFSHNSHKLLTIAILSYHHSAFIYRILYFKTIYFIFYIWCSFFKFILLVIFLFYLTEYIFVMDTFHYVLLYTVVYVINTFWIWINLSSSHLFV